MSQMGGDPHPGITRFGTFRQGAGAVIEGGLLVREPKEPGFFPAARFRRLDGETRLERGQELLSREEGIPPLPAFGNEKGWV